MLKMMKLVVLALMAIVVITACGGEATPEPTLEPTAVPTEEPTVDSSEIEAEAAMASLTALVEHPWQWVSFTNPIDQFDVEMPAAYMLQFTTDGTVNIVADCNNASGSYTAEGSSLSIAVGPMTMAACPAESRSEQYVALLGGAAIYFFEDGDLYIDLMADGGTMEFAPASSDAMSDDGDGAIVDALWANRWQWVALTNPVEQVEIDRPLDYQLTFFDDNTLSVIADCNNAFGTFMTDKASLAIQIGPSTLAECSADSRSDQFVDLLSNAVGYFVQDDNLFIDLLADGGTLEFAPVANPGLTDNPWQWISFTGNSGQYDVEMPEIYVVTFFDDASLLINADCNSVLGEYTEDGDSLTISPGPTTLAMCPGDSRGEQFVMLLEGAERYFTANGFLYLVVEEDGGTMELAPANPEILADDVEGALVDALTANPWQWDAFTNPVEQFDVEVPETYVLQFNSDGTVTIVADCNNASGSYTAESSSLTIEIGPVTMAACPEDSRSDQFLNLLNSAAIYFFEEDDLYIDLFADGGTMRFQPVGEKNMAAEGEATMAVALTDDIVAQLDAFLQSQVYSEGGIPTGAAPGLVLYVETPDDQYLNAVGVTNLDDGTPMQVDDVLEIGSNTKSMTIVLLMQLVEEGLLSLDDTLGQYLPDQAALFPDGEQITLRQMAQHTAGLYDYADNIMAAGIADPEALAAGFEPAELVQDAAVNGSPYFSPGEEGMWYYSNTGYILLGMVIEEVTGEDVAELYQSRIFDPLGMESAIFLEDVPQEGEIGSHGYWWNPDGEIIDTTNWNGSQGWVAGAAAMTAEDLASYGKALAAGELFQDLETLSEMLTFDPAAKDLVGSRYGLGLEDFAGDGSMWGHGGQTLGFQSVWFTKPEAGIVVVGLTNSASYSAKELLNVVNILEGGGALPVDKWTLLPVGSSTVWQWTQFVSPGESIELDDETNIRLILNADQTILLFSFNPDCGLATGAYTVGPYGQISFELDDSSITCDADSLAGQLVTYLQNAASWHFDNGRLVIDLPADGGTMIFQPPAQ